MCLRSESYPTFSYSRVLFFSYNRNTFTLCKTLMWSEVVSAVVTTPECCMFRWSVKDGGFQLLSVSKSGFWCWTWMVSFICLCWPLASNLSHSHSAVTVLLIVGAVGHRQRSTVDFFSLMQLQTIIQHSVLFLKNKKITHEISHFNTLKVHKKVLKLKKLNLLNWHLRKKYILKYTTFLIFPFHIAPCVDSFWTDTIIFPHRADVSPEANNVGTTW